MTDRMTIIVADDHPLFRGAMRQALASAAEGALIVEAGDFFGRARGGRGSSGGRSSSTRSHHAGVSGLSG